MRKWAFLVMCMVQIFCRADCFVLEVPEEKQKIIVELVSTMGSHSTLSLGFKKTHLEGLGKELKGIHPLQFLAYVFSNPHLCKHMRSIRSSSFKWGGFMRGIAPRLKSEHEKQALQAQLPAFAAYLSAPLDRLEKAAQEQKWDDFVTILVDAKR